jgi:hypothetical protein
MALITCKNCGHPDYDHYKGKCFGFNESADGKVVEPCKCVNAKWNIQEK